MSCTTLKVFSAPVIPAMQPTPAELEMQANPLKKKMSYRVKHACEHCKKAKRCCDAGRPCSRCIRLGIESTCRDATRKNKGDLSASDPASSSPAKRVKSEAPFLTPYSPQTSSESSPPALPDSYPKQEALDTEWLFDANVLDEKFCSAADLKYRFLIDELNYFKMAALLRRQISSGPDEEVPFDTYDLVIEKINAMKNDMKNSKSLFRVTPGETGVWLIMAGRIMDWNHAAFSSYGFTSQDMVGTSWKDFFAPQEHLTIAKLLATSWKNGASECTGVFSFVDSSGKLVVSQVNFIFVTSSQHPKMFPRFLLCLHSPL